MHSQMWYSLVFTMGCNLARMLIWSDKAKDNASVLKSLVTIYLSLLKITTTPLKRTTDGMDYEVYKEWLGIAYLLCRDLTTSRYRHALPTDYTESGLRVDL